MIKFKIIDAADQKFSTIFNGRRVTFRVRYNYVSSRWSFDLALDGDYVIHGRRIVPNVDLIEPFDLGIGIIFAYSINDDLPSRDELVDGSVNLYQATVEDLKNALA